MSRDQLVFIEPFGAANGADIVRAISLELGSSVEDVPMPLHGGEGIAVIMNDLSVSPALERALLAATTCGFISAGTFQCGSFIVERGDNAEQLDSGISAGIAVYRPCSNELRVFLMDPNLL